MLNHLASLPKLKEMQASIHGIRIHAPKYMTCVIKDCKMSFLSQLWLKQETGLMEVGIVLISHSFLEKSHGIWQIEFRIETKATVIESVLTDKIQNL